MSTRGHNFVAGADGCRGGWILFKVNLGTMNHWVEKVTQLSSILTKRPDGLQCLGIDIPIGLLDVPRTCDVVARQKLGQPRGCSVFPAPCREALAAATHSQSSAINKRVTGKGMSCQAFGIVPKIKEVDDVITSVIQSWAVEVHPELCFWAMNNSSPMKHSKKKAKGRAERIALLRQIFPRIETLVADRPNGVAVDDLLDAAAAAWSALRCHRGVSERLGGDNVDKKGLAVNIYY